jgi:hypothetical protein
MNKRLARIERMSDKTVHARSAADLLMIWRAEARRRAAHLGAPAVWALADGAAVQALARRVDPSGELLADLRRVCAEAVTEATGHDLESGKPVVDRRSIRGLKPQ